MTQESLESWIFLIFSLVFFMVGMTVVVMWSRFDSNRADHLSHIRYERMRQEAADYGYEGSRLQKLNMTKEKS